MEKRDPKAIIAEAMEKRKAAQERAAKARDARNEAAELAIAEALIAFDGDETKIIVVRLDPGFGGAVVYNMPEEAYWDKFTRRYEAAMIKSSGPSATTVTVNLVEDRQLLRHPPLAELQSYKDETFPGLYDTIRMTIQDRCSGVDPGKG